MAWLEVEAWDPKLQTLTQDEHRDPWAHSGDGGGGWL